jgi:hypothetical protein
MVVFDVREAWERQSGKRLPDILRLRRSTHTVWASAFHRKSTLAKMAGIVGIGLPVPR